MLANDIDASASAKFFPIGEDSGIRFTGPFYGNGYTISNLTINRAKPGCRPECGWNSAWRDLR